MDENNTMTQTDENDVTRSGKFSQMTSQYLSSSKIKSIDFGAKFNVCYLEYDPSNNSLEGLIGQTIDKANSLVLVNCKNVFTLWVTTSDGELQPVRSFDEANEMLPNIMVQYNTLRETSTALQINR